jgi:hypothetical protein
VFLHRSHRARSRASIRSSSRARIVIMIGATTAPSRAQVRINAFTCHQLGT